MVRLSLLMIYSWVYAATIKNFVENVGKTSINQRVIRIVSKSVANDLKGTLSSTLYEFC